MKERTKTLLRETVHVAWPSVVESLLVALVSLVDTMMVSTLGEAAIAAVGLTMQPKFISLCVFFALNTAISSIVARRKGQNDRDSANKVFRAVLIIAFILTVMISTVGIVFADPILKMVGSYPDTHEMSVGYFRIITAGLFFNCMTMMISGAQRGAGNTRISMTTNVASNIVNVIFNYLLIGGHLGFPAWGVNGAAVATVLGSIVGLLIAVKSVLHKDGFVYLFHKSEKKEFLDHQSAISLWKITSTSFLEQILLRIGFLIYAIIVARLGTNMFAAHNIGMNFMNLSFSIGQGLSVAAITLVGQALGKGDKQEAKESAAMCQKIGFGFSCIFAVIFLTLGRTFFSFFTDVPEILGYGETIFRYMTLIVMLQISTFIYTGALRSAGDNKMTTLISFISVTIIRPLFGFIFVTWLGMGIGGAWLGILADQTMRFILTMARFHSGKWLDIIV